MKIKTSICSLLALCSCLVFTSCKEDELSASQNLSVVSFYPTIVMEGTEVEVNGTAMSRVTEVEFPGGIISTEITVIDDRILTVVAPAGGSETEASLIVRTAEGEEAQSRQTIRKANPTFISYSYTDDAGAATGSEMTINGSDLLLVDTLTLASGIEKVVIPALEMMRKTTDAIRILIPDDAPLGECSVIFTFKNGTTMDLPNIEIVEGTGSGSWVESEVILYDGDPVEMGSWSNSLEIPASSLPALSEGDIICVYISDVGSNAQGSLKYTADGWPGLTSDLEYFDLTDDEITAGCYMRTLTEEMITNLNGYSLIVSGQNYTVTKVTLITSVWVEGSDDLRDPITDATIMLNDFEDSGSHNSAWDGSWTDGVTLEFPTESNGNVYLRLAETVDGDIWLINCDHVDCGTVSNIENYAIKFDLLIEDGVTGASDAAMQFVLADNWYWVGSGLFPETTNGVWITVSYNISDLSSDLTGEFTFGTATNGMYGGVVPAGICIDNLRLDPIN